MKKQNAYFALVIKPPLLFFEECHECVRCSGSDMWSLAWMGLILRGLMRNTL